MRRRWAASRRSRWRPCAGGWWRWPARSRTERCGPMARARTWSNRCARCRRPPVRRRGSSSATWCRPASTRTGRGRPRKTLTPYVRLSNYQNYWIEAGYGDEMAAVRAAAAHGDDAAVQAAMSERWLGDVTLYGSAKAVRDGVEAWQATGVKTVILVPSSTRGGQMVAFEELIAAYR